MTDAEKAAYAAGWRAGARKALDAASSEVDCGCAGRQAVLDTETEYGERQARRRCAHGDACLALQAQFLRDATLPAVEYPEEARDA